MCGRLGCACLQAAAVRVLSEHAARLLMVAADAAAAPTSKRSCAVQIMTWELLTQTKFYGSSADMVTVIDALLGKTPLPAEQPLTPEVRKGLGNPTFRETVVAMLSRDPAARPRVPDLVQRWTGMMQHATVMAEGSVGA
jgi:hypothetical protein